MYKLQEVLEDILKNIPIKQIARKTKTARNTIKKYNKILVGILQNHPELKSNIDLLMDEFRVIRKHERYSENFGWLFDNKKVVESYSSKCNNYFRLFEVLQHQGFKGSYSSLLRFVTKEISRKDNPVFRIETKAGEIAQVDFGYAGMIYDEEKKDLVKAYVFVMVLAFSRDAYYEIFKGQDIKTWCGCHVRAFEYFCGVPAIIIPDNLKSAIIKASFTDPIVNKSYSDLAKHYGFQVEPCLPGTPKHKGKVESGVKYVKNNFIPLRTFSNFADANIQLAEWNEKTARQRIHGTTRRKPVELFEEYEQKALKGLNVNRFEIPVYK